MINILREMIKDIEDMDGDYNQGMNTLPIAIGKLRTCKIIFVLSIIPVLVILLYINKYLLDLLWVTIYLLLFVCGPLILFTIRMLKANTKKDFHFLSLLLKFILLFGILSVGVISLNMKYNA